MLKPVLNRRFFQLSVDSKFTFALVLSTWQRLAIGSTTTTKTTTKLAPLTSNQKDQSWNTRSRFPAFFLSHMLRLLIGPQGCLCPLWLVRANRYDTTAISGSDYLPLIKASFIMIIPSWDDSLMKAVLFNSVSRTSSISLSLASSADNSTLVFVALICASISGGVTAGAGMIRITEKWS